MVGSGVKGGNGAGTKLLAGVAGMDVVRGARAARVLPETAPLVPVKPQTPEGICGGTVAAGGKIQPNPPAHNFRQFKLLGQLGFQQAQDSLCGQFAVGVVRGKRAGF